MPEIYYDISRRLRQAYRWMKCRVLRRHTWGWEIARIEGRTRFIRGACMICHKEPGEVMVIYPKVRKTE